MAESKGTTSQAQQAVPGMDSVRKVMDEQAVRMGQMFDEATKAHAKWIEFGNTQLDEMNEMAKTGFNYMNELASDMRKLSMENTRKAMDFFAR
jgi:hypothetical protein